MIIKTAEFITSAVIPSQYPQTQFPEVAFAGRSNVGKSSLINTLVNRKRLVKTSSTPGRTQLINFFLINNEISLIDLPGFGYAKVPKSVQKKWGPMVETYLKTRDNLKAVVLIMDIRRTPDDKEFNLIHWLSGYNIPCIFVITKTDKLSKTRQQMQVKTIGDSLGVRPENLILFSSKTRLGKNDLWAAMERLLT